MAQNEDAGFGRGGAGLGGAALAPAGLALGGEGVVRADVWVVRGREAGFVVRPALGVGLVVVAEAKGDGTDVTAGCRRADGVASD